MRVLRRYKTNSEQILNITFGNMKAMISPGNLREKLETFGFPYVINDIGNDNGIITVFGPNEILEFEINKGESDNNRFNIAENIHK